MGVNWTEEQQKVIDIRDRNILVSAAAGSGKTAVLVERIIQRLTGEDPIDVDRLLIVTFTEAAAAEMKERIRLAIEKELEAHPENVHLQRQATLIHNASITTIHSFCLSVIRDHFHVIDLDPGFRICDEGERKLLSHDIVEQLLEEKYDAAEGEFLAFIERFATGRDDKKIEELILRWYEYSRSYPRPEQWIRDCVSEYQTGEEALEPRYMRRTVEMLSRYLTDTVRMLEAGIEVCDQTDGPYMYREMLESDLGFVRRMERAVTFAQMYEAAQNLEWKRLSAKKDIAVSDEKREQIKNIRAAAKAAVKKISDSYFSAPPQEVLENMKNAGESVRVLADLVIRYGEMFAAQKLKQGMIDFGDMEQFALRILTEEKDGELVPSMIAKEYQEQFVEVMIDEYQDSNLIQEAILTSVSSVSRGQNNMFMVGDVKQSIYSFRLSRPELFMEKYHTYTLADSDRQRIDLHKNFRSRAQVLNSVNYIFERIMRAELGGITYDKSVALYLGADYEEQWDANQQNINDAEVILVDTSPIPVIEKGEVTGERKVPARETEGHAIAQRIKELLRTQTVRDKVTGEYRRASYKDIVILTRSVKGWSEEFAEILTREGIPAYVGKTEGYFATYEVSLLLNYLSVLDNQRQDLPLSAVLTSPMIGLKAGELAVIRTAYPELPFYEAVVRFAGEDARAGAEDDDGWTGRLRSTMRQIERYREMVPYTPIHELLWKIIDESGYGDHILAMPGGQQRKANVDMLVEKAVAFEGTSYKGLFNFIRYIEQLKKYDVDYGEASLTEDGADVVRLMSIHKSKGLEFPIVFVAGMGKQFNMKDMTDALLIHSKWGVGVDAIDLQYRTKSPTLLRKVIQEEKKIEALGEELRILYVALTRAKEKLIMIGTVKDPMRLLEEDSPEIDYSALMKARTYFDWVIPCIQGRPDQIPLRTRVVDTSDLESADVIETSADAIAEQVLLNWDDSISYDEKIRQKLEEELGFTYAYQSEEQLKMKFTVSELKKRISQMEAAAGGEASDTVGEEMYRREETSAIVPAFLQQETELKGASRGTAYHKFLELLDFSEVYDVEAVKAAVARFEAEEKMTKEMAECINAEDMLHFLQCDSGVRMHQAARKGQLHAEQPFVLGVDAKEIYPEQKSDEMILVQGIIDVYFEEDNELVVLDYKTDQVRKASELLERYHGQLDYYAQALEQMTGKKVKEKLIYSFTLHEEISV
ncbi:MAG: helicase-exonuclease AddAB subunit AddA [Hespellia sp.]|nr:helicase-exonuclease AddAB subunit AddA [Hespellia sp.]